MPHWLIAEEEEEVLPLATPPSDDAFIDFDETFGGRIQSLTIAYLHCFYGSRRDTLLYARRYL